MHEELDKLATDLCTIKQLVEAIIRLSDDHAVAAVADQIRCVAEAADARRAELVDASRVTFARAA